MKPFGRPLWPVRGASAPKRGAAAFDSLPRGANDDAKIDVERVVWDLEYRAEVRRRLKSGS